MKTSFLLHIKTAVNLIEAMSIAGWIAVIADVIWVLRDSFVNGFTPAMILISTLLITALVTLTIALHKYHKQQLKENRNELLKTLLKLNKLKNTHNKEKHNVK
ncbi:MAG: hypothetical protein WCP65_00270 [Bacteroidota bacterium]